MFGLIATLVIATAATASAAVIGSSVRQAMPKLRRIASAHAALVDDRVFLFSVIDAPRAKPGPAPLPALSETAAWAVARVRIEALRPVSRRLRRASAGLREAA